MRISVGAIELRGSCCLKNMVSNWPTLSIDKRRFFEAFREVLVVSRPCFARKAVLIPSSGMNLLTCTTFLCCTNSKSGVLLCWLRTETRRLAVSWTLDSGSSMS